MPNQRNARFPRGVILFCADCNCSHGSAKNENLGLHFICPAESTHLGRVILDEPAAKTWLRCEKWLLIWQTKLSPFMILRKIWTTMEAGWYLILSTVFLIAAIGGWQLLSELPYVIECGARVLLVVATLWRFFDIFLSNVSITFTGRFPASPIRSVVYSLVAYVHIALSFAFFYIALGNNNFGKPVNPGSSIFFSFGTIATVGYGDLSPISNIAKFLVVLELVLGLFFVAIILAQVAGWASKSRREEGNYPIDELRA